MPNSFHVDLPFQEGPQNVMQKVKEEFSSNKYGNVTQGREQPTFVILFAYYRSGSSFTGELFNQNTDAFYFYEPLHDIVR